MDIFKSTRLDNSWTNWSQPVNVKEVNTEGRETSFSFNPYTSTAMYVSTTDSDGYGDIKFKRIPPLKDEIVPIQPDSLVVKKVVEDSVANQPIVTDSITTEVPELILYTIKGKVLSAKDSAAIQANFSIKLFNLDSAMRMDSDANGSYTLELGPGTYSVKVSASGFLPHIETLQLDSIGEVITQDYRLTPVKLGEAVKLEHVLFEQGKPIMLPTSYPDLDAVVEFMLDNPNVEIELAGHTDNQGSSKQNYQLSQDRVDVVADYLVDKGISKKRITGKGYGGSRPIASNKNPTTRKLNRRVEFVIVKE